MRLLRPAAVGLALLACALCTSPSELSAQGEPRVAPAITAALTERGETGVLVLFDGYPDLSAAATLTTKEEKGAFVFAALRQNAVRHAPLAARLRARGIAMVDYWIAGATYVPVAGAALVAELAAAPGVARLVALPPAGLERPEVVAPAFTERSRAPEWGLVYMGVPEVWAEGTRGAGVTVAGQDTGYDWTHPALRRKYRGTVDADSATHDYNWHDAIHARTPNNVDSLNRCGYDVRVPCDDGSHGTHTMGTMVGSEGDTLEQTGVAPEAEWIGCRNMDRGDGTAASYLECFQWFLAPTDLDGGNPRPELAPHVIANSWVCPLSEGCDTSVYAGYTRAIGALRAAGVVVVVSAGNSGPACNTINGVPAQLPGAFSVGAHDVNGRIAGFSSRGSGQTDDRIRPDVAAPGVAVRSTVPDSGYASFSGTSMAGPHVAGLVALMISANPAIAGQVDTIEAILRRTADGAAAPPSDSACAAPAGVTPNYTFGYGRVDAMRAVAAARAYGKLTATSRAPACLAVTIAPNPVGRGFTLAVPAEAVGARLTILDATGRTLLAETVRGERTEVYSAEWAPGVYYYRIAGAGGEASGKLVR